MPLAAVSQEKTISDPIVGDCSREDLTTGDFGAYFEEYYRDYDPESAFITGLESIRDSISIVIVLGTWCHDSQEQVPRFFKVLDEMNFDRSQVQMICVDTSKEVPGQDVSELGIVRVPTFIIYRGGEEAGRIVETPVQSLERDLLLLAGGIQ